MKKSYTVEMNFMPDGTTNMTRTNDGFSGLELLGVLSMVQMEILQQLSGQIKPDITELQIVKRRKSKTQPKP
jgi:hypothetical protein